MKSRFGGFALPTVLIASIVMLTVLLVAVTSTAAVRVALVAQYYSQLSQAAGDAGAAYAKSCLLANNNKPLWSNGSPLKPDTDCAGAQLATCPVSPANAVCHTVMLDANSGILSTFTVSLPQLDSSGQAVNISSVGSAKLLRSSDLASGVITAYRQYSQTSNIAIASSPTVAIYAWGGGGAGGTIGGWSLGSNGGAGGAAQGMTNLSAGVYPVVVGGGGVVNSYSATFSCAVGGGGCGSNSNADNRYSGGGGGYSGIFTSTVSQSNALLIAGGGGGGGSVWNNQGTVSSTSGGAGGGAVGQMGYGDVDTASYRGQPGTQSAAGATVSGTYLYTAGAVGANIQGALQGGTTVSYSYGGGGGGGYWGGSAGGYYSAGPVFPTNQMTGGGGGSSYFNSTLVTSGLLSAGAATTPGNAGSTIRGTAGNAGGYQANGSSGAVIISYPTGSLTATGGVITTSGGNTFHTFASSGNFTVGSAPRTSCLAILNAGESTGSGVYWIYPSGLGSGFQAYCDMTSQGGGWTLAINLQTSDANIRHYDDTDFWTGTAQYGNVNTPFANDFKSTAFSQVPATELMMMANNLGAVMGTAKYSLIAPATGNNLYWMFNNLPNTTITGNRTGNSGSVGSAGRARNDGDGFIDHTYPVIINSTYQPLDAVNVTRLGTNYAASCAIINCNGHTFGGWGGRTSRATWGAYYEGAAINGYCSTQGGFGTNGSIYTTYNAFDGTVGCGSGTLLATVDMAVFVR